MVDESSSGSRLLALKDAFDNAVSAEDACEQLRGFRVPGDPATRSRWFFLLENERPELVRDRIVIIDFDAWRVDIDLENKADASETALKNSVELWEELGRRERQPFYRVVTINSLIGLADHYRRTDDRPQARLRLEEAETLAEEFGYSYGVMRTHVVRGHVDLDEGSTRDAVSSFRVAAAIASRLQDPLFRGNAAIGLAHAHLAIGDRKVAFAYARKALRAYTQIGSAVGIGNSKTVLAAAEDSRPIDTIDSPQARTEDLVGEVEYYLALGDRYRTDGDVAASSEAYVHAKSIADKRYPRGEANAWAALGRLLEGSEDPAALDIAKNAHHEALTIFLTIHDRIGLTYSYVALSSIAFRKNDVDTAMGYCESALLTIEDLLNTDPRATSQESLSERFSTIYVHAMRSAIAAGRPDTLLMALENLAGRRLAGVSALQDSGLDAWLTSGLSAISAEATAGRRTFTSTGTDDRQVRLRRGLGRIAIGMAMPDIARRTLEDAISGVHEPVTHDGVRSLAMQIPDEAQTLIISAIPGAPTELVWWYRPAGSFAVIGSIQLISSAAELVEALVANGIGPSMRPADVAALMDVIPDVAREDIRRGVPLILIPLGRLAALPWPAVPVGDRFLAELTPFVRCPTLSLYAEIAARPPRPKSNRPSIALWRNPTVQLVDFSGIEHDPRWSVRSLERATDVRAAMSTHATDVVAVACHGRPTPGIGHYMDLGDDIYLTPADLLKADPPETVLLVSCWGAMSPHLTGRDPLSIPNILVARGSRAVLATTSQLADSAQTSMLIADVVFELASSSAAHAYNLAVRRFMRMHRDGPLNRWAPASVVGVL